MGWQEEVAGLRLTERSVQQVSVAKLLCYLRQIEIHTKEGLDWRILTTKCVTKDRLKFTQKEDLIGRILTGHLMK